MAAVQPQAEAQNILVFFMYKMHTHFAVVRVELIPIWVIESSRNIPQPGQFWTILSGCLVDCFFLPTPIRSHRIGKGQVKRSRHSAIAIIAPATVS